MKLERQSKILQLISEFDIETQEDLANRLTEAGFYVTQATVSRDIRELKLTKISTNDGRQRYVVIPTKENQFNDKFIRVLKDAYISMDRAQNILVLRTVSGMAMAVAAALDSMQFNEIIGSIAGDDTIFCAIRTENDTIKVMEKISRIINR